MSRIRHIAIRAEDTEELAKFYKTTFEMKEVFRQRGSKDPNRMAIYLSDGHLNMAILPAWSGVEGIDHFGFEVEDGPAAIDRAFANGATKGYDIPKDGRFNEAKIVDPVGSTIDISSAGWALEPYSEEEASARGGLPPVD